MRLLMLMAVGLVATTNASAGEIRVPQITEAVQMSSGIASPDVSCEPNPTVWELEVRALGAQPNSAVGGYTLGQRVRLAPWICSNVVPTAARFGDALYVIGVEAARLAGHRGPGSEAMAGCWGLLWVADLARRVWRVPFFTAASERAIRQALAFHRGSYERYRQVCV